MSFRYLSILVCAGLAAAAVPSFPALSYSTYLRDNFTPAAIATDSAGNIYLTGSVTVDQATSQTTALVLKLNPQASQYLYVRYVGGSVQDSASAIAVDATGNAYIAGVTTSPDFPVTGNSNLATPPTTGTERSFVTKLDPNGQLVFSQLLGGSTNSFAQAVAVTPGGQVVVSGLSVASGFPSTSGAYSVSDTSFQPFLLELNPAGTQLVFSATGIGGSALVTDSSGNIYMAGTTSSLTYPTTAGTYQPAFPTFLTCTPPCMGQFQGPNQYVTKVDPTGSKLIFSTALSGNGNTANRGIALDAAGNIYVTGLAGAGYPYTVTPPAAPLDPALVTLTTPAVPFLSKLDPNGQKLLFSVPVGGSGVQVDSSGAVYVGGILGVLSAGSYDVAASLPALAAVPPQCLPNGTSIHQSAYVSQVDSASGNVLGSQFIGGSSLSVTGVALGSSKLWVAAATDLPDFPFSGNVLTIPNLGPNPVPGAYLGAVDFSQPQPPVSTPQIGCILDAANLAPAGPIVPFQLLTLFGTGLGPSNGAAATDNSTTTLGGVTVNFGSLPAPLLYASSNQINLAVPLVPEGPTVSSAMQVTVAGVSSAPREFPVTYAHPNLFLANPPINRSISASEVFVLALNADGSLNSSTNPAHPGSTISVFVNGLIPLIPNPLIPVLPLQFYTNGGWSVTGFQKATPFVLQVDLQVPSSTGNFYCPSNVASCVTAFTVYDINSYLAPIFGSNLTSGLAFGGEVYVTQGQVTGGKSAVRVRR